MNNPLFLQLQAPNDYIHRGREFTINIDQISSFTHAEDFRHSLITLKDGRTFTANIPPDDLLKKLNELTSKS